MSAIDTSPAGIKAFVEACRMSQVLTDLQAELLDDRNAFYDCRLTTLLPESVNGNIFARTMKIHAGGMHPGERHNVDHVSVFRSRHRVRMGFKNPDFTWAGKVDEIDVRGGDILLIEAHKWHEITSLEDGGEFVCFYPLRDHDGFITQRWNGSNYFFQ